MLKRVVLALLSLTFVAPVVALDLQSTTVPGRTVPSLTNGEVAINRADKSLYFKNVDGTIGVGSLLNATAAGRQAVEQGKADTLTVGGATLPSVLGAKAPLASPTFTGTATVPALTITGPGSSGDVSGFSVTPSAGASTGTLAKLLYAPDFPGTASTPTLIARSGSFPSVRLFNTAADANARQWEWIAYPDGSAHLRANSDDYATSADALGILRSGTNVTRITLGPSTPNAANIPAFARVEVGGAQNALIGATVNDKGTCVSGSPANCGFPTGVTGYGNLPSTSPGNSVFGLFGRADCRAAGVCTNEVNSFNYTGQDAPAVYPVDRSFGTTSVVPVALTVAAGGTGKSAVGIDVGQEGEAPNSFQFGLAMRKNVNAQWNIYLDADATSSSLNGMYSAIRGGGTNLLLKTTDTAVPGNAVIRHVNAAGTETFRLTQAGDLTGLGTFNGGTVLASSSNYPSVRINNTAAASNARQWEWIGFPDGSFHLRANSDDYSTSSDVMAVTRSGTTATGLSLNAPTLTSSFSRTADPTTADIPAGRCADWNNTTAGTFKHVCNFGGTLRSVAMAP